MSNPDALAILSSHFDALKPQRVEVKGLDFPLFYRPITSEQAFKMAQARAEKSSVRQTALYAELLIATVEHEDGTPVFPLVKGGPNPIEVLTKRCPAPLFSDLVTKLYETFGGVDEAEDVEKKSEPQDTP